MGEVINLSCSSHLRDLSEGLWKLCRVKYKTDVALDFKKHGRGNFIALHHLILAVLSPKFKDFQKIKFVFNKDCGFSEEDINLVIEFIYLGRVQVKAEQLPRVVTAAEALGIESLLKTIEQHYHNVSTLEQNRVERAPESDLPGTEPEEEEEAVDEVTESDDLYSSEDEEESDDDSTVEEVIKTRPAPNAVNHKPIDKHGCPTCKKQFKSYLSLVLHLRSHKKKTIGPHKCSKCTFATQNRFNLRNHMAAIHQMDLEGNVVPKTVKCPQCDYVCLFKFQLRKHNNSKHIRNHVCSECGYSCSRKANLRIHINGKHKNERAHMCELCGYRSSYKSGLKAHMNTHSTDKTNVCEICGQIFATQATLKAHIKTHGTGPKPYSCHLCKFTSWTRYSLKMHYHHVHKNVFSSSEEFVKWYKELQKNS